MKIFKILVVLGCSIFMAQGYAAASNFNYDYVEVGSVSLDTRILDVEMDADTVAIVGSFDLFEHVNVLVERQSTDYDFDLEGTQSALGIGYHQANRRLDLYLEAFYVEAELAFPENIELEDEDETGYGVNIGVRSLIGRKFELDFSFANVKVDVNQTAFSFAGRYYLHRTFALGLSYSVSNETHGSGFALRVGF
jgi:hypothetical protein